MAAMTVGFSLSVTSCKDDDNQEETKQGVEVEDGKRAPEGDLNAEEKWLLAQQEAIISILTNLTGISEVDPRFDLQKYEPTYGTILDEAQPLVRAVKCETVKEAEQNFRDLVGSDTLITYTPDGMAVSLKDMPLMPDGTKLTLGSLVFHSGDGQRQTGYVEVDIPCIPKLQRIDYLVAAAFPDNANSPYQLGDLVYLPRGNKYCSGYYLCVDVGNPGLLVHLCYGEAKSDETINLDGDGCGVWYPYNRSQDMPTRIENIKSYVNFLLEHKDKVYKVKQFLSGNGAEKPSVEGKLWHVLPGGFATDDDYAYKADEGVHFWYEAKFDGYAWIPAYDYRKGFYGWVPNYCNNANIESHYWRYVKDSTWKGYWKRGGNHLTMNVIRFWSAIDGARVEFSPVKTNMAFENDAVNVKQEHVGWVFASDGRIYATASKAKKAGATPLGIVAYVNDGSEFGNAVTEEESGYGHGLVLCKNNANSLNCRYSYTNEVELEEDTEFWQFVNKTTGTAAALTDFQGLEKTATLLRLGSTAAGQVNNYSPKPPTSIASKWFIPSAAQWIAILCSPGIGGLPMPSKTASFPTFLESGTTAAYDKINSIITSNSWTYHSFTHDYWSSSAYSGRVGVYVTKGDGTHLTWYNASSYKFTRPVFAF